MVIRSSAHFLIFGALFLPAAWTHRATKTQAAPPATITIDYPEDGSIFPPEITPPAFVWHEPAKNAKAWLIEVAFTGGAAGIRVKSQGEGLRIDGIDPRCIAETNERPRLTPYEATARSWRPDEATWNTIKHNSQESPATVTIYGLPDADSDGVLSRGRVAFQTSKDPVGAPVFYRDVPLMPSELEKGVIKPIVPTPCRSSAGACAISANRAAVC